MILHNTVKKYRFNYVYFNADNIIKTMFRDDRVILPSSLIYCHDDIVKTFIDETLTHKNLRHIYEILINIKKIRIDINNVNYYNDRAIEILMGCLFVVRSMEIIIYFGIYIDALERFFETFHYVKDRVRNVKIMNPIGRDITMISNAFDLDKFSLFTYNRDRLINLKDDYWRDGSQNKIYIRCKRLYFDVLCDNIDKDNFVIDDMCTEVIFGDRFPYLCNDYQLPANVTRLSIIEDVVSLCLYDSFFKDKQCKKFDNITHLNIGTKTWNIEYHETNAINMDWLYCPRLERLVVNGYVKLFSENKIPKTLKSITYNIRHYNELQNYPNKDIKMNCTYMRTLEKYEETRSNLYKNYLIKSYVIDSSKEYLIDALD
jgi:hypothetical protein